MQGSCTVGVGNLTLDYRNDIAHIISTSTSPPHSQSEGIAMPKLPIFGLSSTPIADIKSELRLEIERNQLTLVYREAR